MYIDSRRSWLVFVKPVLGRKDLPCDGQMKAPAFRFHVYVLGMKLTRNKFGGDMCILRIKLCGCSTPADHKDLNKFFRNALRMQSSTERFSHGVLYSGTGECGM